MESRKFIFVAGLHRSGTTILAKCLRDHPDISGFTDAKVPADEGQFLQSVYKPARAYGGPGYFGFNKEAYLTEESELVTEENRQKLFAEWSRYWDITKPILLEKSPPNIIRMRFLQAMFPQSYFLVIQRHPIAVSFSNFGMRPLQLKELFSHWLVCHKQMREDLRYLSNFLLFRYEEFVLRSQAHLESVYRMVDADVHINVREIDQHNNDKYFAKWNQLSLEVRKPLIEEYEDEFQQFGYSLSEPE
ncbi:sulfotransferase [Mechercharimyces sp. CAU 1602]|uniref:sulfotransferase family protein n=1 Tax=Mechercharimyces sp. CAU 1602 TaxID=2973933 RepID=UPI002161E716|nr:sulfotransferase [Mechercharimyces sp. CAU 1602]MCS1350646.1 sulfotransferase [Mechercharimyces sp. CAU 1602]